MKDVKAGDTVKVLYSLDNNTSKEGFWYDCVVQSIKLGPRPQLKGDIIHGRKKKIIKNCIIKSLAKIIRVGDFRSLGTVYFCQNFSVFKWNDLCVLVYSYYT